MRLSVVAVRKLLKKRKPDSHKGQNGRVLIVGGSREYYGSPVLTALGALRASADLVYISCPERIAPVVASYLPDFIVWSYEGSYLNPDFFKLYDELERRTDALVIGNGITKNIAVLETAREIIARWKKPIVIDADAIQPDLQPGSKQVVYIPHPREFERLAGEELAARPEQRITQVKRAAKKLRATVLLKGPTDIISDGTVVRLNTTGNAGMTAGGTGDTLAGACAAFLAQGNTPLEAACLAAYLNGLAGDLAFVELGNSLIASDVAAKLPLAIKKLVGR